LTSSDFIAVVQALFLAAAAFFAWRGYSLATSEHCETRAEARRAPIRELLGDVIREVKDLADQAEERVMPAGIRRDDLIAGHQRRLAVALTFTPPDVFNLFASRDLAACRPDEVTRVRTENVCVELLRCFAELEAGWYTIDNVVAPGQRVDQTWRQRPERLEAEGN
jgi:hypothetical protein